MGERTIKIKNLLKRLINRRQTEPTKDPEPCVSKKEEDSENYMVTLNNMVCSLWSQYELNKDIDLPV